MQSQIFINLPVANVDKSMAFYSALGFSNNPNFSDETAKCMVWNDSIMLMIMTHDKFKTFTTKPIADTKNTLAALLSVSVDGVDRINEIVNNGIMAGGTEPSPFKDYGFMQQRTIEDFDGHTWEIFCMDLTKFPTQES